MARGSVAKHCRAGPPSADVDPPTAFCRRCPHRSPTPLLRFGRRDDGGWRRSAFLVRVAVRRVTGACSSCPFRRIRGPVRQRRHPGIVSRIGVFLRLGGAFERSLACLGGSAVTGRQGFLQNICSAPFYCGAVCGIILKNEALSFILAVKRLPAQAPSFSQRQSG